MNKQEVKLEEGCFYLEQLELGGQIIFNRYHKILSKNEDYKHRNVFFSEQFTTRNNGEIEVTILRKRKCLNSLKRKCKSTNLNIYKNGKKRPNFTEKIR